MYYDLIIVSKSIPSLISMTQKAIDSARADTKDINVIIVETGQPYKYSGVNKTIEYNGEFNYNRALNLGLKYTKGDVHILANNDLIFHTGWSRIGELMKLNGYHSASALAGHMKVKPGDYIYEGYMIEYLITGWCLFIDKFCLSKIGRLDEACSFWYSDNLYACQIEAEGIRHALFCNVRVDHLESKTLHKEPPRTQRKYKIGELHKYNIRRRYYAERENTSVLHTEDI